MGILISFAVGCWFGIALMCCLQVAGDADRHIDPLDKNSPGRK